MIRTSTDPDSNDWYVVNLNSMSRIVYVISADDLSGEWSAYNTETKELYHGVDKLQFIHIPTEQFIRRLLVRENENHYDGNGPIRDDYD